MTEGGVIKKGTTQIGEVKRPLAAVSDMTKANQIVFFCEGEDWIIDRRDPLAEELIKIVQRVRRRTRMYEHKGTYRVRAWMIPGEDSEDDAANSKVSGRPFGRQGP